jgi:hypothetical protein
VSGIDGWEAAAVLAELRNGSATEIKFDKKVTLQPAILDSIMASIASNHSLSRIW